MGITSVSGNVLKYKCRAYDVQMQLTVLQVRRVCEP